MWGKKQTNFLWGSTVADVVLKLWVRHARPAFLCSSPGYSLLSANNYIWWKIAMEIPLTIPGLLIKPVSLRDNVRPWPPSRGALMSLCFSFHSAWWETNAASVPAWEKDQTETDRVRRTRCSNQKTTDGWSSAETIDFMENGNRCEECSEELLHRENRWRERKQAVEETSRQCKHSRCQCATVKICAPSPKLHLHIFLRRGELRHMRSDLAQIPAPESRGSSFTSRYVPFTE